MTTYRVLFQYGPWQLWTDIESPEIEQTDKRGFEDLAQNAVKLTLNSISQITKNHIAHDYQILKLEKGSDLSIKYRNVCILKSLNNA